MVESLRERSTYRKRRRKQVLGTVDKGEDGIVRISTKNELNIYEKFKIFVVDNRRSLLISELLS